MQPKAPAGGRLSTPRVTGLLLVVASAVGIAGCGPQSDRYRQNIVSGSFDGGKLIALNEWVGTNSVGSNLEAYADVADGTPGVVDVRGPEHWRCSGVLRTHAQVSSGTFLESKDDRLKDQALNLPSFLLTGGTAPGVGFVGPAGSYKVTIEVPGMSARFRHSWQLPDGGWSPITMLYDNAPACLQVADNATQQRSLGDRYLNALQRVLTGLTPSATRTRLQGLLDQARVAKVSGTHRTDPGARAADYRAAAAALGTLAKSTRASDPGMTPTDVYQLTTIATNAAAILSQTGLS